MTEQAVCRVEDLDEAGAIEVTVPGTPPVFLIVLKRDGVVRAYHNVCPHAGRPLNFAPGKFLFTPEDRLVCTVHGASFETRTGHCVLGPCMGQSLRAVETEVRDDSVYLMSL